jgi:cephalosporin hydroxylase
MTNFKQEVSQRILNVPSETGMLNAAKIFMQESLGPKYSYNFEWLGRPIIQYPQDIVAMQELIWEVKPDLIIETGIAHGGSLILSASILAILDICEAIESNTVFNPKVSKRKVLGIDIDIREHNKKEILNHPMSSRIEMIEGSSISDETIEKVKSIASDYKKILICLDSNHTHDHVLAELELYANLTSVGSYCIVFDTVVEDMPNELFNDRPWKQGNNPKTAVKKFLENSNDFIIDKTIENKIIITVAPDGFLKRIK